MESGDIVKVVAIVGLVAIEIVNLFTTQYDGALMGTIGGIIGGIAGYQFGRKLSSKK